MKTNASATNAPQDTKHWMDAFGIEYKDRLSITKAQLLTRMRPGNGNTLRGQIWACGILHTAGYQGQKAVKQVKTKSGDKKVILLTAGHIAQELHEQAQAYYRNAGIKDNPVFVEYQENGQTKTRQSTAFAELKKSKENIRRELMMLEIEGLMERQVNGKLLKTMTLAESKKLAGRADVEMYFFLRPKPDAPEKVREEWKSSQTQVNPQVVIKRLLQVPMRQILKAFNFEPLAISNLERLPNHEEIVAEALEACKEKFSEVVTRRLLEQPAEVVTPTPPEVVTPGGALEEKGKGKDKRAAARVSSPVSNAAAAPQETRPPAAAAHPTLQAELNARGFQVHSQKILSQIVAALNDCPLSHWLKFLDKRISQGKIGAGLLPDLADDCRQDWQASQQRARDNRTADIARQQAEARAILANPNAEVWEREWAEEVLKETQVA